MAKPKAHVADYKKDIVKNIASLLKKYPIIGCLNMENLPASQMQNMRAQLRGKVEIFMTKRRLIKLAIEAAKKDKEGIEKIEEYLAGMPALLFTEENPFSLFRTLKKNKSKAPAKAGQIAPEDLIVPKGPTPFAPGPVIGELGALGIKSKVEEGKIAILEDSVVCKKGEEISGPLAGMLTRLNILPMEVGLDLVAVYEKGSIFTKDVLDIDEEKFMEDLMKTARAAFNLSLESGFITETTKEAMVQKAYKDAKAVALEACFMADAVVEDIIAKAERQANALKSSMPELPEAAAEAPKVEEKKEEKAPEPKPVPPTPEPQKPAEEPKKDVKPDVTTVDEEMNSKVADMVSKLKQHEDGTEPNAEKLVDEVNKESNDMKKVAELAEEIRKKGSASVEPNPEEKKEAPKEEKKEENGEQDEVADLTKKLMKKGTLRK